MVIITTPLQVLTGSGGVYGKMSIDKESYEILCSIHNRMDHHERHMRIALRMEILYKN